MKGILEFNLPEEQADFKFAQDGAKWLLAMEELYRHFRGISKHDEKNNKWAQKVVDKILEILSDRELSLYC